MKLPPMRGPAGPLEVSTEPGTCMYGDHLIPAGEPYVAVLYSRERVDGTEIIGGERLPVVTVDDCGAILFACTRHAPSEEAVIQSLRGAGMPV